MAEDISLRIKTIIEGLGQLDNLLSELKKLGVSVAQPREELSKLRSEIEKLTQQRALISQFGNAQVAARGLGESLAKARAETARLGQQLSNTQNPSASLRAEFDKSRAATRRLIEQYNQQQQQLQRLRSEMTRAGLDTKNLANAQAQVRKGMLESALTAERLENDLKRLKQQKLEDPTKELQAGLKKSSALMEQLRRLIYSVGAAWAARDFVNANREFETLGRSLSIVTKDGDKAAQEIRYLAATADELGAALHGMQKPYISLRAAASNTTLTLEQQRNIFESIVGAQANLGRSSIETSLALKAVEQMISKGKVQAEELRGQLGEQLPGAFQLAAKAMGVSTAEMNKMLELGQVVAEDLLPKMADEIKKAYGVGTVENNTFAGAVNRMGNAWDRLLVTLGETGIWESLTWLISKTGGALKIVDFVAYSAATKIQMLSKSFAAMSMAISDGWDLSHLVDELTRIGQEAETALEKHVADISGISAAIEKNLSPAEAALEDAGRKAENATKAVSALGTVLNQLNTVKLDDSVILRLAKNLDAARIKGELTREEIGVKLANALDEISGQQLLKFKNLVDGLFEKGQVSALNYSYLISGTLSASFKKLGKDFEQISTGFTETEREAKAVFSAIVSDITVQGKALNEALSGLLNSIETPAGLIEFQKQLQQLQLSGRLTGENLAQLQPQIAAIGQLLASGIPAGDEFQKMLERIQTGFDGAAKGADPLFLALQTLGVDLEKVRSGMSDTEKQMLDAFGQIATAGNASGKQIEAGLSAALDKIKSDDALKVLQQQLETLIDSGKLAPETLGKLKPVLSDIKNALSSGSSSGEGFQAALEKIRQRMLGIVETADPVTAALERMGVDLERTRSKMTSTEKQMISDFKLVASSANSSAEQIQAAFNAAIQSITTPEGLKELNNQLQDLQSNGELVPVNLSKMQPVLSQLSMTLGSNAQAGEKFNNALDGLKENSQKIADGVNIYTEAQSQSLPVVKEVADAQSGLAVSTKQAADALDQQSAAAETGGGIAQMLSNKLNAARAEMRGLSEAAAAYFEQAFLGAQSEVGLSIYFQKLKPRISDVSDELERLKFKIGEQGQVINAAKQWAMFGDSISDYEAAIALAAARTRIAYYEQQADAERLSHALENVGKSGTAHMYALEGASRALNGELGLLNENDLSRLRGALDDANNRLREMQELAQSASERLSELKAENLELSGNKEQAELLRLQNEYTKDALSLEAELARAKSTNNRDAIRDLEQSINLLKQNLDLKERDIRASGKNKSSSTNSDNDSTDKGATGKSKSSGGVGGVSQSGSGSLSADDIAAALKRAGVGGGGGIDYERLADAVARRPINLDERALTSSVLRTIKNDSMRSS